jgi:histidyl-tRNA synthetase
LSTQAPKGTRDFYPADQKWQNFIFDTWKQVCIQFGYEEYEGPIFEHLDLFTDKSGDEIVTQLYNFQDKGGRDLALRPEMTPTLARLVNQKNRQLKKPFKWFSMPRLFRYERAQKGRLREFFQLNMDIMGTPSIYAEVDLLLAIIAMLQQFKLTQKDFIIGISSRRVLAAFLQQIGIEQADAVYPVLDKQAKISREDFMQKLKECGIDLPLAQQLDEFMQCKTIDQLVPFLQSEPAIMAFKELQTLFAALQQLGMQDYITLDLSIVRGLAYYTGIVFEVFDAQKSMRALAGGGRYDNLCARLGGEAVTGVGFGMGDVVLKNLLEEKQLLPTEFATDPDVFIAVFGDNLLPAFSLAQSLRKGGLKVAQTLQKQKFNKQLDAANACGAAIVLFADSEANTATHIEGKVMATGEQTLFAHEQLLQGSIVHGTIKEN